MRTVEDVVPAHTALGMTEAQPTREAGIEDEGEIDLVAFLPLVRSIAARIHASIPAYAGVELNDLVQSGHLGLVHASRSYQQSRKVPFAVYARFRIRGEILDSLRQVDVASRTARRMDKQIKAVQMDLASQLMRDPTQAEVCDKLQSDLGNAEGKRLETAFLRLPPVTLTSLEERETAGETWQTNDPGPDSLRAAEEARELLRGALERLPARSRELIQLYYQNGLTMREIGERFNVNESRVSQLHRRALQQLERHLKAAGIHSSREI